MGFLKMFGVGGGKLDVILDQTQVKAGGSLSGVAKFIGGKRAQQIDALTLSMKCTTYRTEQTPEGPRRHSNVLEIVPKTALVSNVQSEPGGELEYPFAFPIPETAFNSAPGAVEYRLFGAADIDGEVDPGDSEVFTVVGGQEYDASVESVTGAVVGEIRVGDRVVAQWQDGNWYAGRVANIAEGMYGVDWDEERLGASAWVQPHQIMTEAAFAAQQADQAAHSKADAKAAAAAKAKAAAAAQAKVAPAKVAPAKVADPKAMAAKAAAPAPSASKAPAPAAKAPVKIGMAVVAQFTDGNWHPAKVVQIKEPWIGVDWDDPKLGQSSWVQAHQIKPR